MKEKNKLIRTFHKLKPSIFGAILVLIGIQMILKINIKPFVPIIFGILLIWIGLTMMVKKSHKLD